MQVKPWLIHRCTKRTRTGRTTKGDPTYGPAVPFDARVERQTNLVRNARGEDITVGHVLMTQTLILPEDFVWFPSIDGSPADDVNNMRAGHAVVAIAMTMNKSGREKLWQVYF